MSSGQQVVELEDHADLAVAKLITGCAAEMVDFGGPPKAMVPLSGASSVPSRCRSVLLPEPL